MPTYEYRCRDCGEELEVVQSFSDDALTECPACGGSLRKVFGNIGITFKGSGFYKTDARAGSKSASSSGKKAESGSSEGGSADSSSTTGSGTKADSAGSSGNGSSSSAKPADTKPKTA